MTNEEYDNDIDIDNIPIENEDIEEKPKKKV